MLFGFVPSSPAGLVPRTEESPPKSVSVSELSFYRKLLQIYRICSVMFFFFQTLKTEDLL